MTYGPLVSDAHSENKGTHDQDEHNNNYRGGVFRSNLPCTSECEVWHVPLLLVLIDLPLFRQLRSSFRGNISDLAIKRQNLRAFTRIAI